MSPASTVSKHAAVTLTPFVSNNYFSTYCFAQFTKKILISIFQFPICNSRSERFNDTNEELDLTSPISQVKHVSPYFKPRLCLLLVINKYEFFKILHIHSCSTPSQNSLYPDVEYDSKMVDCSKAGNAIVKTMESSSSKIRLFTQLTFRMA